MNSMTNKHSNSAKGFSLIELMVVLGVVGLLLAIAAPNLFSLISSNTLTGEGQVLRNQLTYAQQIAISKNADVEVRFFRMPDLDAAQTEEAFRAFQLFQYNSDGDLAPISTFFRIRNPVAGLHRSRRGCRSHTRGHQGARQDAPRPLQGAPRCGVCRRTAPQSHRQTGPPAAAHRTPVIVSS